MVKLEMRVASYKDFGVDVPRVNFAKIAEAAGFRVESSSDLKDAFWSALRHKGPAIADVSTNPHALAIPRATALCGETDVARKVVRVH
jgi:pyruvate dehydrogenase (quinone)